jgi:glycosyltransferase involved in cell wall biosynthesis
MLITTVIAVYKNKNGLEKSIKSVIDQSHIEKELIVIDGGSQDGTVDVIHKYEDKIRYWESQRDRGIYQAWNKALNKSKGEWVCFLGSGDYLWHNNVLKDISEILIKSPTYKIVYGKIASIGNNGTVNSILGDSWTCRSIRMHRMPPHAGTFHSAEMFKTYGFFDETFKIAADYDLMLRELRNNPPLFMPDIIVAGVQDGGVSAKLSNYLQLFLEDMRARKNNSICSINAWLSLYYIKMLACWIKRDFKHLLGSRSGGNPKEGTRVKKNKNIEEN